MRTCGGSPSAISRFRLGDWMVLLRLLSHAEPVRVALARGVLLNAVPQRGTASSAANITEDFGLISCRRWFVWSPGGVDGMVEAPGAAEMPPAAPSLE
jgi:hypothetical protein